MGIRERCPHRIDIIGVTSLRWIRLDTPGSALLFTLGEKWGG